ncbi:predicted protein [Naegleria gruberi]|uniref:Predicted protein n=1 Tax=Naegleria gruberi TaxID=5762 RepID=D2UZ34_NAEGR|nr:uncharacterized protein NAEGRDRAFT_45385 [Naegleria gruberi]EFC50082.1 predicted protein [Naegleria gruberi]|eukprot:XP_002682826.1 predicted protein [Naegleria gruberi strain NEG-M]
MPPKLYIPKPTPPPQKEVVEEDSDRMEDDGEEFDDHEQQQHHQESEVYTDEEENYYDELFDKSRRHGGRMMDDDEEDEPNFASSTQSSLSTFKPISFITKKDNQSVTVMSDEKDEEEIIIEDEQLIDQTMGMTPEQPKVEQPKFVILQAKKKVQQETVEKEIESTKVKEKPTVKKDEDFGSFIGGKVGSNVLRMMYKMGWKEDKGLGPTNSGIINPIKVVQTSRNQAVIISDEHVQKTNVKEEESEKQNEETIDDRPRRNEWKKKKKKNQKPKFKSIEQLLKETPVTSQANKSMEIIDMTGPTARVVSKLSDIQKEKVSNTIPELQYNVKEIIRQTESSIRDVHEKIQREKENFDRLDKQRQQYEEKAKMEKKKIDEFQKVFSILSACNQKFHESKISLSGILQVFTQLKQLHSEIFEEFNFSNYGLSLIRPILSEIFKEWNPLSMQDPEKYVNILLPWRNILKKKRQGLTNEEDYEKLLQDLLIPSIRKSFSKWNPIDECDKGLNFFETFADKVCTEAMKIYLTERLLIPRLKSCVQGEWNPKTDNIPVHSWIQPWFIYIPIKQFETYGIFNLIKNKLDTQLLRNWNNIDDQSAYQALEPWKDVFNDYYKFLVKTITPTIVEAVKKISVIVTTDSISTETREHLSNIIHWNNLIPEFIVAIFESQFFNRWWKVLYSWLCDPDCIPTQVDKWYQRWKDEFDRYFEEDQIIQLCFKRGLDMIYQSMSNTPITPAQKLPLPSIEIENKQAASNLKQKTTTPSATKKPTSKTFKELISDFAEEHDLPFQIKVGQYLDGKQLYNFGGISTYIENECLHAKINNVWKPVTLNEFLSLIK